MCTACAKGSYSGANDTCTACPTGKTTPTDKTAGTNDTACTGQFQEECWLSPFCTRILPVVRSISNQGGMPHSLACYATATPPDTCILPIQLIPHTKACLCLLPASAHNTPATAPTNTVSMHEGVRILTCIASSTMMSF